jgi:hypothetical protein
VESSTPRTVPLASMKKVNRPDIQRQFEFVQTLVDRMDAHRRSNPISPELFYTALYGLCGQNRTELDTGRSGYTINLLLSYSGLIELTVSLFSSTHCFSFEVLSAETPIIVTPESV